MPDCVIETQGLTKMYGTVAAVRGLDLRVPASGVTGFLGQNGAGKSSTIRMLLGISRPTAGGATVLGLHCANPKEGVRIRQQVAYVGEDKQLYRYMTVAQMLRFTRSFYADWQDADAERLIVQYRLPLNQRVGKLSKGMRTKLALLLALARRPRLLMLDEPTEGLDPVAIEELLRALVGAAARGTPVFFSSHQIADVQRIADRVCILEAGELRAAVDLETMRDRYRQVTMWFAGRPPAFSEGGHALSVEVGDRFIKVLSTGNVDDQVARATALGAVEVSVTPVDLRTVFLAVLAWRPTLQE